ncbi:RING finger protein 219 [Salarias fasciatus]|uniref:RING-type domain-containing protein n=1 Tax=Salarias fasciatus TaxID=181472 RepID=A0A672IL29_SALFA|nr:RING finger protein 219 [Salarias fasciatus]
MAQNFQSSILSLTLPISCQICLGKVRQPVICTNHHVFCSSCMEMWLKKASQCPTCRVPITAESPYREIIGGSNDSDHSDDPSVRKCLRKTRGELLLREYEEEIEKLLSKNEELKTKNLSLEAQLKAALSSCSDDTAQPEDQSALPFILKDLENNVQAAEDTCAKLKQDMEKLKETNKALRSQNNDLVQENMRLKVEVDNRSPHKFGRFTVAALEAKIQHYERDIDHLKRALDRSDQYIDDLESRLRKSEKRCLEMQEASRKNVAGADSLSQQRKINMVIRSLSYNERELICSNPEAECSALPRNPSATSRPAADRKAFAEGKNATEDQNNEDSEISDFLPTTPSAAFRTLTLRSPGIREKKVAFKPPSHQRRLDFNVTPEKPRENPYKHFHRFPRGFPHDFVDLSKSSFWGCLQKPNFDQPYPGPSQRSSLQASASSDFDDDDSDNQMSSEACMNAAYLDKISELDSMMLEGEGSANAGSQLPPPSSPPAHLERTLIPDSQSSPAVVLPNLVDHCKPKKHLACDDVDDTSNDNEAQKCSAEEGLSALEPGRRSSTQVPDSTQHSGSSQSEELSFDLLFDPVDEAGPSGSLNSAGLDHDRVNPSSSSSCTGGESVNTRAQALNSSQPVKRKSHSPFCTNSPTKLSKLM